MAQPPRTRTAYFNGRLVPETQVVIPYRDRSFNRGDGCFDMTRTFDGRIFRLEEHVERLYRSLSYLGIDVGLEPKEMVAISEQVVERNEPLRAAAGDWWVAQRVSRGVDAIGDEGWAHTGAQLIVDCTPLPLRKRAAHSEAGQFRRRTEELLLKGGCHVSRPCSAPASTLRPWRRSLLAVAGPTSGRCRSPSR